MSPEELLKPRYKVIADYPGSDLDIGEILYKYEWDNGNYVYTTNTETLLLGKTRRPAQVELYPHLFKKLEWWEDREEKDMPDYVKYKDEEFGTVIFEVDKWIIDGEETRPEEFGVLGFKEGYLPATEEEYKNQNK